MNTKKRDKYLQRVYGISLDDYNHMLKKNDGGCWICKKKPKPGKSLHVDHWHTNKFISVSKTGSKTWVAVSSASITHKNAGVFIHKTKQGAIDFIKDALKRFDVRGLLCYTCNRAIQRFKDDPVLMESAAKYIKDYQERVNGKS